MIRKALTRWACNSGFHHWQIELRGQKHKGFVYPIRFRTCQHCKRTEHEIFDVASNTANWTEITE